MEKQNKIIYWVSTGLFSTLMLFSATMYFVANEMVVEAFTKLGYPTYLIYPLAIVKFLGIIAILSKKSKTLKEWAYAGFFFDLVLAVMAHIAASDGEFAAALVGIILVVVSFVYDRKMFAPN